MERILENILQDGGSMFTGLVESMKNIALAQPITMREPDNVEEAIKMHDERARLLRNVQRQGFTTIAEYNKYREAEDLIAKHKEKMQTQQEDSEQSKAD